MAEIPIVQDIDEDWILPNSLLPARLYLLCGLYNMNKYLEEMKKKYGGQCKNMERSNQ